MHGRPRTRAARAARALAFALPLLLAGRNVPAVPPAAAQPGDEGRGVALHDARTRSLRLPDGPDEHRVWLADLLLRRAALVDGDSGRYLGTLPGSVGAVLPLVSHARGEIYLAGTFYSRGVRGVRSDVLSIYDARTLAWRAEVALPPRRGDYVAWAHSSALSDDGRFVAVWNLVPATSLSIVDVEERRLAAEIATPGCHLAFPAGPRRFAMLCGDGTLLLLRLAKDGREAERTRSARFFDPVGDPVTEKAVRIGDRWLFVSFEGHVHEADLGGGGVRFPEPWSLFDAHERAQGWRIGGVQHLAAHAGRGELYALVHRGGEDTHKDPGEEVRVYDVARHERTRRIALPNLAAAYLGHALGFETGAGRWLLEKLVPSPGALHLYVTPDDRPQLFVAHRDVPVVGVLDAVSGELQRELHETGFAINRISAP